MGSTVDDAVSGEAIAGLIWRRVKNKAAAAVRVIEVVLMMVPRFLLSGMMREEEEEEEALMEAEESLKGDDDEGGGVLKESEMMGCGNDGWWGLRERLRGCLAMDSIFFLLSS